jgi:glutamyl/glutaminyl-tRNA synthetase
MQPPVPVTRTRLAPTPSGFLHLGNILSFCLTAADARQHQATIRLRIDDLDRARLRPAYVEDIFDTLQFLGIPWHEGPADAADFNQHHSQLTRLPLYAGALNALRSAGHVFACACSRTTPVCTCRSRQFSLDSPGLAWRLDTTGDTTVQFRDHRGVLQSGQLPGNLQHFVVRKKDGYPAYQLASVVDDTTFGIDYIVRGADLYPSTLAQLYLARVLGLTRFAQATFRHHALLTGPGGEKLSKSAGSTSVQYLRRQGHTPAGIFTAIAQQVQPGAATTTCAELGQLLQAL